MVINVYIDVLFFIQLILMIVINDIGTKILNWKRSIVKNIIASGFISFLNTGYYICILKNYILQGIEAVLLFLGEVIFISIFLGRSKTLRMIIKSVLVLTFVTFLIGGGWYGIQNLAFLQGTNGVIIYAIIIDAMFHGGYELLEQGIRYQNNICTAEITIQNKTILVKAYYDSGNCLTEPYGGRPVAIISQTVLLQNEIDCERKIMVPYYSLGNDTGMIEAIAAESLYLKERDKMFYKVYLAIDYDIFIKQKSYDLILHNSMI